MVIAASTSPADVLPWQRRFSLWTVALLDVASEARDRVALTASAGGARQLYAWDRSTETTRQLTDGAAAVTFPFIDPEGRWVYFVDDPDGSELGWLARVPFEGGRIERLDAHLPGAEIRDVAFGPDRLVYTRVEDDRFVHRVWRRHGAPSAASRVLAVDAAGANPRTFTADGRSVAFMRYRTGLRREIVLRDAESGAVLAEARTDEGSLTVAWASRTTGDERLFGDMDVDGRRRPITWDPRTGVIERLPHGDLVGDVRPLDQSPNGRLLVLAHLHQATTRLHVLDLDTGHVRPLGLDGTATALPWTFSTAFVSNEEIVTLAEDGAHPPAVTLVPVDGSPARIVVTDRDVPPGHPWRSAAVPVGGDESIHAWVATPAGPGPFPTIIDVHGGPQITQGDWFNPTLQAFVDHGYAVISPNYHGSAGFGLAFEESIHGRPGELELEDLAAVRAWAIEQGIADPDHVVVEGVSHGGYVTLLALGRQPELWAAGIASVAIGDWEASYAEQSESIRQLDHKLAGGSLAEYPERYRAGSPITYADAVRVPVLIIQGRGDVRCPAGQMERYLERMEHLDKDVTVHWFDAGHVGGSSDVDLDHCRRMLAFLDRVHGAAVPDLKDSTRR